MLFPDAFALDAAVAYEGDGPVPDEVLGNEIAPRHPVSDGRVSRPAIVRSLAGIGAGRSDGMLPRDATTHEDPAPQPRSAP
jgi:hypothetical protein